MKFLVDESLSSRVASLLADAGQDAIHVTDRGLGGAPDEQVLQLAARESRAVISVDTDFGELLALGQHSGPSVVLLRRAPHRPEQQVSIVLACLPDAEESLVNGAVVVVAGGRVRVRLLPIGPQSAS